MLTLDIRGMNFSLKSLFKQTSIKSYSANFKGVSMLTAIRKKFNKEVRPWFISRRKRFEYIYHNNGWHDPESRSGHASTMSQTRVIRKEIPVLLKELKIKSLLDIPCGDLNWIREMEMGVARYTGADIVPVIIKMNKTFYPGFGNFLILDLTKDKLPHADLIFCRDCLVHLSFKDILRTILNIKKSKAAYFLTTTFTKDRKNTDIPTGKWRTLNLMLPPFNWPDPIKIINEGYYDLNHIFDDKSLGLWKIDTLPKKLTW